MIRTEKQIDEDNKRLNAVIAEGPDIAIGWLRAAFHTHVEQVASLIQESKKLRKLLLENYKDDVLSVEMARTLHVCRVCKESTDSRRNLTFNYGDEYAHTDCLPEKPT